MHCEACGLENPEGMTFCGQCAARLLPSSPNSYPGISTDVKCCGTCGSSLTPYNAIAEKLWSESPLNITQESSIPVNHQQAERRQLTVLFCDLVGSTALSERMDPEDLRDIIGEYQDTCRAVVKKYNGHIAQYLGDGVLIYFGYPVANEDDAVRAVQTGLELVRDIQLLSKRLIVEHNIELSVRVGIHTGLVVIGVSGNDERKSLAIGTTPNIAARLQDLARPNTVVISDVTRRLVQSKFLFTSLGPRRLKGLSRPVGLYQIDATSEPHAQHYLVDTDNLIPLIGREKESELILDRLTKATVGEGQIMELIGEAGIGKSRLVKWLRDNVPQESCVLLECWGSPYHKNSFLYCVIEVLQRILEMNKCESDGEKLTVLETPLIAFGMPLPETVPLLAELLSISLPEGVYPDLQYTYQQRKQKTLEALLGLLLGMASKQVVVIIVEDLHWVDPTTIELLGVLIDQAPAHNIFGLFTYRVEFTPPWAPRSHLTQITINRLTREQSGGMINWIAKNKALPLAVFNDIIGKTDGTPLFVEELTKMVLESGSLKEMPNHYELAGPLSSLAIPSTLHDSLMARLDRLGPGKEVAQLSATLGREFSHALLHAVASGSGEDLDACLAELVCHELLYQRGIPPQATYTFRHALVHEVAYQSLLKKTRVKFHRKIANVLNTLFPDKIEKTPEIMAHHCTEAGDYKNAAKFWLRAGRMAMQRFANSDAVAHLHNSLNCLKYIKDGPEKIEIEIKLQSSLGAVYMPLKGYSATEVEEAYGRAYRLCCNVGNTSTIFPVLCGLWAFYLARGDLDTARELALKLQVIANKSANEAYEFEALRAIGVTAFLSGNIKEAYKYLLRGIEFNVPSRSKRDPNPIFEQDTEVALLGSVACVCWQLGYWDEALNRINQTLSLAIKLNHPLSVAHASSYKTIILQLRGDASGTEALANSVIELCKKYDLPFWLHTNKMLLSWARFDQSNDKRHIGDFERALDTYIRAGSQLATTYYKTLLARMYIQVNDFKSALSVINQAISRLEIHQEQLFKAEIFRLKAEALSQAGISKTAEIEIWFIKAIDFSQYQDSLSLELRATTSYCRFLKSQKQYSKAHKLLSAIVSNISEEHIAQDWVVADRLLSDLTANIELDTHHVSLYRRALKACLYSHGVLRGLTMPKVILRITSTIVLIAITWKLSME